MPCARLNTIRLPSGDTLGRASESGGFGLVSRFRPVEGLQGTVSGPVRVDGTLSDLRFGGALTAGEGRLVVVGSVDLESLGAAYTLDLDAEGVSLSWFTDRALEPSLVSGHLTLDGSGFDLDSLVGQASVALRSAARRRASRQAARTAEPTEAMVIEPPCGGVGGKPERPRLKRIRSGGSSSASAVTCVIEV